jgi:hypothetical protein
MDSPNPDPTVPTSEKHEGASNAAPSDAMTPDEAASLAELAFIQRVRSDRARALALRRSILTSAALIAAIAVLFLARGIPRWPGADNVPPTGTALTPRAAPSEPLPPTRDAAGTPPLSQKTAVQAPPPPKPVSAPPKPVSAVAGPTDGTNNETRGAQLEPLKDSQVATDDASDAAGAASPTTTEADVPAETDQPATHRMPDSAAVNTVTPGKALRDILNTISREELGGRD